MVSSTSTIASVRNLLTTPSPATHATPTPHVLTDAQTALLTTLTAHFSAPTLKLPTTLPVTSGTEETRKALTDWEKCSLLNREALVRCLRADKWEVDKCIKRVEETVVWRRDCGADQMEIDEQQASIVKAEAETGKMFVLGFDLAGRPIVHMRPRFQNTSVTPMRLQFTFWLIDRAIDLMPLGVETVLLMIDLQGPQESPALKQQREFLKTLSAYYCERLGKALVINMPTVFVWVLKLLKPLIDPVTMAKLSVDSDPLTVAPAEQLDDTLGGSNGYAFDIETYWPALMTECQNRRRERLSQWTSSGKSVGSSEWITTTTSTNLESNKVDEKAQVPPGSEAHSSSVEDTPAVTTTNSSISVNDTVDNQLTVPVTLVIE